MYFGLSTVEFASIIIALIAVGLLLVQVLNRVFGTVSETSVAEDIDAEVVDGEEAAPDGGHVIEIRQPQTRSPRFGIVSILWRLYRKHKKRKKVGEDGYVEWYLVDDAWPEPKFVKPESEGGGVPEYEYDGTTYLFPRQGRLPNSTTGMWTVVHSKGDAKPINLELTGEPAIDPQTLNEYATMRPSSSPPSLLDKFDTDPQTIFAVGLAVLLGLIGVSTFL